ncbi:alanine racemase [Bacillus sp. SLBN-46]|uniref:alanine racemase n=1 Tax=Bacillus sp. SLBN-46 TaxID=3042283 RepID=UPI00285D7C83|nr:alanine racemase [Bacillus sp. SLBN-46]MDR6124710.1 alanine racemase [Bacillus sp. SLBN-46]
MHRKSYRDTWAEVSLDHIQANVIQFRQFIQQQSKLMAVVKADGYGHGAVEVAKAAILAGADYLGVALLDEAIQLREAGIVTPILILGYTPPRSVKEAIQYNITLTVFDDEVLDKIIFQSAQLGKTAYVHLKIDTGMSRIGVTSSEEALLLAEKVMTAEFVYLEGIFTHFSNADNEDPTYTYKQLQKFESILAYLDSKQIPIPIKHCCNSAATMNFPEMHMDMVRIGIALYGLYPDKTLKSHPIQLKQAMSLKTRIAALKNVKVSQPISYGCTWSPEKDSKIATLPIGYADGLSRLLSNKGKVLIRDQHAKITGRVCMDQTMIDITGIENCTVSDEVTIFGNSHSSFQSIDQLAEWMGTINYEVVCLIGKRVPRVYLFKKDSVDLEVNKHKCNVS